MLLPLLVVASALPLALALALALPDTATPPPALRLLHRVFHPSIPEVPFTERGSLLLLHDGPIPTANLVASGSLHDDVQSFAEALNSETAIFKDSLYQVALEHPGDENAAQWHISSVKACHLARSTEESLTLHVAADGTPYALDYFVGPVPHNGACPKRKSKAQADLLALKPITNSTVIVRAPTFPPLPQLRTPPPLTPEGQVVQPVPEKSFIQKYWMYLAIAAVALVLSPSAPEEDGKGGGKR